MCEDKKPSKVVVWKKKNLTHSDGSENEQVEQIRKEVDKMIDNIRRNPQEGTQYSQLVKPPIRLMG